MQSFRVAAMAVATAVTAAAIWAVVGSPNTTVPNWPAVATLVFTHDQLNACAVEAALESYMVSYDSTPRTRESAEAAIALDGYHNILGRAEAYIKQFGGATLKTVYEQWADKAPLICIRHALAGEAIVMPTYGPPPGYHDHDYKPKHY